MAWDVSHMRSRSRPPGVLTSTTSVLASTAAAIRSDWLGGVSTSTHVSGSDGGTATVKRLATSTSNGRGSPAARALDAQSVALPCGSMSLTSTLRPRRLRARAVQMVLVVLPTPPFMFAMAMMRGIRAVRLMSGLLFRLVVFPSRSRRCRHGSGSNRRTVGPRLSADRRTGPRSCAGGPRGSRTACAPP